MNHDAFLTVSLSSCDRRIYTGSVQKVQFLSGHGMVEILPDYGTAFSVLKPGVIRVFEGAGKTKLFFTLSGIAHTLKGHLKMWSGRMCDIPDDKEETLRTLLAQFKISSSVSAFFPASEQKA